MEQHSDIVVKNIPFGGPNDKEKLTLELREAIEFAIRQAEINVHQGELVMVDIQENASKRAEVCHAFICFENYWRHSHLATELNGMVTVRRKNLTIEISHNRACHGPDYIGRTWVQPKIKINQRKIGQI